jgi:gluconate 2-dehydrogenase gamma chain
MERRNAIKTITLGAMAGAAATALNLAAILEAPRVPWSAEGYQLRFFNEKENALLDQLMEMIIPADAHSPGAHAAQVSLFADLMVATSPDEVKQHWREGLQAMQADSQRHSMEATLAAAASQEANPQTPQQRFFVSLKQMTLQGYYTSEIGIHQDLQYQGNSYLDAFQGCTHPSHQS